MQQIKKKQHYVWKKYLSHWSGDQRITALLKSSNKIILTSRDGVVQERFFYALEEYTEEEEVILKELVERWSSDDVIEINRKFYETFISYSKIKRELQGKDTSGLNQEKLEHQLNVIRANTIEDIYCNIEGLGNKLIGVREFEDIQFLKDNEEMFKAMVYLSFQYLRTKKMSEAIKPVLPKYDYLSEKFLNVLPFIYAPAIAYSLTYNKETCIIFYDNKTSVDFITSDQPIINEKQHILKEPGVVAQMDLFYPITPRVAIVVHYQEQREKYKYVQIKVEEVIAYNQLMFNSANEFVFANNSSQLEQYI